MKTHTLKAHLSFKRWGLLSRKALFCFFTLLSLSAHTKTIKIAILDTGFCLEDLTSSKRILVLPKRDITQTNRYDCAKTPKKSRRLHGQWVLEVLIKQLNLDSKNKRKNEDEEPLIQITPIVIFDKDGHQKYEYWKTAVNYINSNDFHLLLSAVALPLKDSKVAATLPELKVPIAFFAAQRKSKDIDKRTFLYPHILTPKDNILIVGSYYKDQVTHKSHYADTSLTHPKTINYYMPYEENHPYLKGSSFAVTKATQVLLEKCQSSLLLKSTDQIKKCLAKRRTEVKVKLKGKVFESIPTLN